MKAVYLAKVGCGRGKNYDPAGDAAAAQRCSLAGLIVFAQPGVMAVTTLLLSALAQMMGSALVRRLSMHQKQRRGLTQRAKARVSVCAQNA